MLSDVPSACQISTTVTITVQEPSSAVAHTFSIDATGVGVVEAGASSMSFFNYGPNTVTINNKPLTAGAAINFPFLGNNIKYGEIPYDATGSTIRIDWTVIQ